jgi:hypothetical protein
MKHLNLKLQKLEERIAPGGLFLPAGSHRSKSHRSQSHRSRSNHSRSHRSRSHHSGSKGFPV